MTFSFAHPAILILLLVLPVFAVFKLLRDRGGRRRMEGLVARRLVPGLVVDQRPLLGWVLFLTELVALGSFIVALAQPRYGFRESEMESRGRTIMLAVDTSRSMLAQDLLPSRLQRALLAAHDLVLALPEDRIGVIAFAGRAFVQAPLTIDHEAVLETLSQLDAGIIPRGGTNISEAIKLAVESFDKAESANHALIVFTDGDELEGDALNAAREAANKNVMIITVGVGSAMGGVIPDSKQRSGNRYVLDGAGKVVRTRLDSRRLEELARATRGLYLRLDSGGVAGVLVKKALENLDQASMTSERTSREPIERYRWPLAFGVVLLLGSWVGMLGMNRFQGKRRYATEIPAVRSTTTLIIIGIISLVTSFAAPDAVAAPDERNLQEKVGRLSRLLAVMPEGRKSNEWRFARGAAAFRLGDFDRAIEDFGQALLDEDRQMQEQAHYNLGNAIAQKASFLKDEPELVSTNLENAIEHYDAALELNANNANAEFNRDAIKAFLKQVLKKMKQQKSEDGDPMQSEGGGDSEQQSQSPSDGEQGDEGQQNPGENPGEGQPGQQPGDQSGQPGEGQQGSGEGGEQETPEGNGGDEDGDEGGGDDSKLDGELTANKPDGQNGDRNGQGQRRGGSDKKDPRTGFSPSEARQLLRALSDEDRKVRPIVGKSVPEGDYKDW